MRAPASDSVFWLVWDWFIQILLSDYVHLLCQFQALKTQIVNFEFEIGKVFTLDYTKRALDCLFLAHRMCL